MPGVLRNNVDEAFVDAIKSACDQYEAAAAARWVWSPSARAERVKDVTHIKSLADTAMQEGWIKGRLKFEVLQYVDQIKSGPMIDMGLFSFRAKATGSSQLADCLKGAITHEVERLQNAATAAQAAKTTPLRAVHSGEHNDQGIADKTDEELDTRYRDAALSRTRHRYMK